MDWILMHEKMEYVPPLPGVDINEPLIYMWEIRDSADQVTGRYIGKASGGEHRPTSHYTRNVNKMLRGRPYKKGSNYRRVHFALYDAVNAGHRITLSYLCNVPKDVDIFEVEHHYIRKYGCDLADGVGLNGPWKGTPRTLPVITLEPTEGSVQSEDSAKLADLEDFVDYVQEKYPELTIDGIGGRYSVWATKTKEKGSRIVRAKQAGSSGKVRLKLAQTNLMKLNEKHEFTWDGTEEQLTKAIDSQLGIFQNIQS